MDKYGYANGYIEYSSNGKYEGVLRIDGVDISPIEAIFFKDDKKRVCIWIKRKPLLEYDDKQLKFVKRTRKPQWEAYMVKSNSIANAFNGEFMFLRFKYSIFGQFDITQENKTKRINLYVERLPMREQTIINKINGNNNK